MKSIFYFFYGCAFRGPFGTAGDTFIVRKIKIHCGTIAINQETAFNSIVHNLFKKNPQMIKNTAFKTIQTKDSLVEA